MQPVTQQRDEVRAFMAECFWPGVTEKKVAAAGGRAYEASHSIDSADGRAHHLGSILVPNDEVALFLLEAASLDAATALAQQAAIPAERILEIVRLGAFLPSGRHNPTARQRSFDDPSP